MEHRIGTVRIAESREKRTDPLEPETPDARGAREQRAQRALVVLGGDRGRRSARRRWKTGEGAQASV
jgi:hypothetical protein